ncbi:alpha-D-ribose 1-methylphosphonate 5-triphosphate diphosphatase [Mastigocoleus testarum]|uniref:Phosphonate metabolism protein PhnM n=1 Tax=Mastigocoleus testarum BC008 TaxID=371196 RepID=A0A0V7ZS80_9CYAN|nr:alpha-D-ribose 1-methylphosphonate 5-triphosphate diphosphatase [Mastigocoleus testarum]KST67493.1 phosphonate metabolism protein PhnM [Mastigocoleus testarum BC008]
MKTYITRAHIVTSEDVIKDASLLIEDGYIIAINPESTSAVQSFDLDGKLLIPGCIDLHCDAIEKEIEPRPNTFFPTKFAVAQVDRRNAAAGITTPFHAISFANEELGVRNNEKAAEIVRAIHDYQPQALVDNRVHCRYEITDPTGLPILLKLLQQNCVDLFSLMDHTPGQGQFKDLPAYLDYISRTYNKTTDQAQALANRKLKNAVGALERIKTLVSEALRHNIQIASHDDDTLERIQTMTALGVKISEFPINLSTAQSAKRQKMKTIFGAPNLLRGKSQSGSIKAVEAIENQVCDILCSDYSPASLLASVFQLPHLLNWSLPDAISLVTRNPAQALNLHERGEIEVGKRADLIAIKFTKTFPQIVTTWVRGKVVFQTNYTY